VFVEERSPLSYPITRALLKRKRGRLSVSLTSPASSGDDVGQCGLRLFPATSLKTAVRVDEKHVLGDDLEHSLDAVLDLLLRRHARRVDVVHTGANLVRVSELLERREELHVALGRLNGDDVCVEALNRREDVVEVGVAEVGVRLRGVGDSSRRQLEGVDSPFEVGVPVDAAERQTFTNRRRTYSSYCRFTSDCYSYE